MFLDSFLLISTKDTYQIRKKREKHHIPLISTVQSLFYHEMERQSGEVEYLILNKVEKEMLNWINLIPDVII